MTTSLKVRFDGKTLVPLEPVELPIGQELKVEIEVAYAPPVGSMERLRKTLSQLPPVDEELYEQFERELANAKQPP